MNTVLPVFYVAKTTRVTLGGAAYSIVFVRDKTCSFPCLLDCYKTKDEFDDDYFFSEIAFPAEEMPPMATLYFVKSKLNHGFEYRNDYGNGLGVFYEDSWVWCPMIKKFVVFDDVRDKLNHPSLISGFVYRGALNPASTVEVLFHRPRGELRYAFENGVVDSLGNSGSDECFCLASELGLLSPKDRIDALFKLMKSCDFISAWQHGPLRPVLFSCKMGSVLQSLSSACVDDDIAFVEAPFDTDFPSW